LHPQERATTVFRMDVEINFTLVLHVPKLAFLTVELPQTFIFAGIQISQEKKEQNDDQLQLVT
jgi:hypothetical protein